MDKCRDNEINCEEFHQNVDYQSLEKGNEHFSITKVRLNEEKCVYAYNCIYRYENHFIKLEYYLSNAFWKIICQQYNKEEEQKLNNLLDHLNHLQFDQQIQLIIKRFDHYFQELRRKKINEFFIFELNEETENIIPICSIIKEEEEEEEEEDGNNRSNCLSLNDISSGSIVKEDDHLNEKSSLVVSHRIRHSSTCSTASSVRYASFVPPSMESVTRKRLIQSILLHVQQKKRSLEKLIDTLTGKSSKSNIYQLGLQFLRIYDGKFDYQEGHTFVMLFQNESWLLTIDSIQYVQYEIEQKSTLILNYKNKFTFVKL